MHFGPRTSRLVTRGFAARVPALAAPFGCAKTIAIAASSRLALAASSRLALAALFRLALAVFFRLALAVAGVLAVAGGAAAVEPVQEFLDGLRERRYFDEAVDYLEALRTSPTAPPALKNRIDYEQGVTLLQSAAAIPDFTIREKSLAQARTKLEEFCQRNPEHEMLASARGQLAGIRIEQGRIKAGMSKQGQNGSAGPLLAEARQAFEGAKKDFESSVKGLESQLQKMRNVSAEDPEQGERKALVADELARSRLNVANSEFEIAKTFEGEEAKKHLKAAAGLYSKIFEDYRMRQAGLLAHLWEGVCYQEMGEMQQAVGCYKDIMDLELKPSQRKLLRSIRNKGYRQALECWTSRQEHKYVNAIERGEQWTKDESGVEADPDALAIRYYLAVAYEEQAKSLPPKDPTRRKYTANASKYVLEVAKHPGEFQKTAKAMKDKLSGKEEGEEGESDKEPTSFAEASERGKAALDNLQAASIGIRMSEEQKDHETLATLTKEKEGYTTTAFRNFKLALALADKGPVKERPEVKDVNSVRYFLCFLYYDRGEYYDSAVLGDYLARRYPETMEGRQGARIMLASFVKLFQDSKQPDKSFEIGHIQETAEYITKHWPKEDEAEDAALTLLNFAIQQRELDKALEYLNQIPETSPRRGTSELRAGQALWATYLKAAQAPADERSSTAELERTRTLAEKTLAAGIERLKKAGEVTPTIVGAMLSLAQIYLDQNDNDKTIATLEEPTLGPLTLVKAKDASTAREGFAVETYKTALRAYVGKQDVKGAKKMMDALEKAVSKSGDAKAGETLTQIYISLGRELQQQLERLRKGGQKKELEAVSTAFETFLSRIISRGEGNSYSSLSWVAETFYSLATGFDDGSAEVSAKAKAYYGNAVKAYEQILARAAKDTAFLPNVESLVGIRLRMAVCERRLGDYDAAVKLIADVLKDRPTMLTAQIEGAETYCARGATEKEFYNKAIVGGEPNKAGDNIIWGWGKLAKMTQDNPKFEDTFYQARLKIAESRYHYGLKVKDKEKRKTFVDKAKKDLWLTYKLYPNLGGANSYAQYDRLLKQIQENLGDKPIGMQEFKDSEPAEK
jgi:tetratricopeptide (TPR) repeat protein